MTPAATPEITFNKSRLNQNISHKDSGIVNVICCQRVLGKTFVAFAIQLSVCFLPHEEQNLPLHVNATVLPCEHSLHLYFLNPSSLVLQARSLLTLNVIPSLRFFLHKVLKSFPIIFI